MSQMVETPTRTFEASAAIAPNLRVKLDTNGQLAAAGAAERSIGVLERRALAANELVAVRTRNAPGTRKMVAAGAITARNYVYGAASGKVDDIPNGNLEGIALEAATADGDVIEVLPVAAPPVQSTIVEAKTADYTVTLADSGKTFTTVGASGTVVFAMPAAVPGLRYGFRVGAAQELRIDPDGTEKVSLPSTGVPGAAGKYLTANADGETVYLECTKAGEWTVVGYTGTWTAEA